MNDEFEDKQDGKNKEDVRLVSTYVTRILHASIQAKDPENVKWINEQMPNGFGPVFAIHLLTPSHAQRLPSHLDLFHHATSLGGVESLVEWRAMSDDKVDRRLVRFSIGVEDVEDLVDDVRSGLRELDRWSHSTRA
jgi:cystathionine gamma-synthase